MENLKLTNKEKALYSSGSLGMGVVTVTHMLFLVWFFIHDSGANLPYFIRQDYVVDWGWFGLTVMGLLLALRTLFDAVSDPIIAFFSDKFKFKKGTRVTLLKWSAIPFAFSYLAVFFVPVDGISNLNIVWIAVWLVICTFFLTMYSINHEALMAKMTKNSKDRIDLGTIASASWFVGFVLVSLLSSLWGPLSEATGIAKVDMVRIIFAVASIIGGILMILPGLFIDESKYEEEGVEPPKKVSVFKALGKVMKYKNYRKFVFSNTLYTSATVVFESGLIFFVTILAVLSEGTLGILTIVIGGITLAMYPLINRLAKTKGRKFVLLASFVSYTITFLIIAIMTPNPSPWLYLAIILVVAPFSQAGFGILPVVIASDNAEHMKHHTGEDMSGMYMAVSGFFRKLGSTIASVMFTSFLVLGNEVGNDKGIRYAVIFAGILAVLGFVVMRGYNEKEVMNRD